MNGLTANEWYKTMSTRPTDIVSPITNKSLGPKTSADDAQCTGRFVYDKPTPENAIVLLVDHQIGLHRPAALATFQR